MRKYIFLCLLAICMPAFMSAHLSSYNIFLFAEVEGGGMLHLIHGDEGESGIKFSPTYGVRIGARAGSVAIWTGFVERGVKKRVNSVVKGVPIDNSVTGEIGVAIYF